MVLSLVSYHQGIEKIDFVPKIYVHDVDGNDEVVPNPTLNPCIILPVLPTSWIETLRIMIFVTFNDGDTHSPVSRVLKTRIKEQKGTRQTDMWRDDMFSLDVPLAIERWGFLLICFDDGRGRVKRA